jgi:transcriptional regulator with XRE-family HTH domain
MKWIHLVKQFRLSRGLNQSGMADLCGVRQATVSRWESGKHFPDRATRNRLRAMLSVQDSKLEAYTDVGFNAAIQPAALHGFTLSVYGKNLTDNAVILGAFIQSNASAVSWAPPRTFGFNIGYDF